MWICAYVPFSVYDSLCVCLPKNWALMRHGFNSGSNIAVIKDKAAFKFSQWSCYSLIPRCWFAANQSKSKRHTTKSKDTQTCGGTISKTRSNHLASFQLLIIYRRQKCVFFFCRGLALEKNKGIWSWWEERYYDIKSEQKNNKRTERERETNIKRV